MESPFGHRADWRVLLERREFVFLFLAVFVSLLGSGMNFAGVTWYVLAETHSPVKVSLLTVLVMLPGLVVPVVGGVLIDRVDRRHLGIVLDLARGAIVLGTAAFVRAGLARLWHIYAMMFLLGVGFAIYWSTVNALAQEVIPRGQYAAANSGVLIAIQGGMMTGGSLVGFVYKSAGLAGILGIDGLTYLAAATCLLLLRRGRVAPHAHRDEPLAGEGVASGAVEAAREDALGIPVAEPGLGSRFLGDLREGVRYLRGQPRVLALGITYACMMGGVVSSNVVMVTLTQDVLHSDARGFGFLEAGWAFGAVSGGLSAGVLAGWFSAQLLLIGALAVLAAGQPLFPYSGTLVVAVGMNVLFGACRAFGGVLSQTGIMSTVPRRLMGRTLSTFSIISTVLQVLMSLALGFFAQHLGLPLAFFVLGLLYGCAVLAAIRARELEARPAPDPAAAARAA
ncbi:MAG TPA: MFS transporter [Candidatus Acidoferrales bacterium]|nr:MFS transporter [Candidatus Acidoferrales bacterium]